MLVDNKFIFISLPRCASTSFFITCLKMGIKVQHYDSVIGLDDVKIDTSLDNETIADTIMHAHERLPSLEKKFGNHFDIISVSRNRYDRFLSLWKHVLDETYRVGEMGVFERFRNFSVDDILFYESNDLISSKQKVKIIKKIVGIDNFKDIHPQISTMVNILISPISDYHNNDPRIIWFDFNKLNELEQWVSNKLNLHFKLEKSNSSNHFESNLNIDEIFISKYNSIYDFFELPKNNKTII